MIRDITIGQYYTADSTIHRLDARTKVIFTFFYVVALFVVKNYSGFIPLVSIFLFSVMLSKIPVKYILRGLKPILFIVLLTVLFNYFGTFTGKVIFKLGFLEMTDEGLKRGTFLALRLILLMLGTSMMTFTTTPTSLTDALEHIFKPLKYIRVPVHELAMMMSIALRFIPILMEETDRIMKAQLARGADFESGNIIKKAKALVPVLVPLFVSAFRRAGDLAMAMEARCYRGGDGRTKMKPLIYKKRDAIAYIILFSFVIISVWLGRWQVINDFFNSLYVRFILG